MEIYAGFDWSAKDLVCATATGTDTPRRIKGTTRTYEGVCDLVARIRKRHPDAERIVAVIEDGAPGWAEMLHHAGVSVHVADPKKAKRYAELLSSSGAKDDGRDAGYLARMARSLEHRPEPYTPQEPLQARLGALTRLHQALSKHLTAAQQRLRSLLREHLPAVEAALKCLSRRWVHRLLRIVPTAWHAQRLTREDFVRQMKGSGARQTSLAKVFTAISASTAPWQDESLAQILAAEVRMHVEQIELLGRQLREVEEKMDALTANVHLRRDLEAIDGIGARMANRLLHFAFNETPTHRDQVGIKLGACPVFRGSGRRKDGKPKGTTHMRRATKAQARSTAYLLGRLASQQLDWAAAQYQHARDKGKNAATAYRIVARSFLRIISAMARTGEPYDHARYVATLKEKGVPWAAGLTPAPA